MSGGNNMYKRIERTTMQVDKYAAMQMLEFNTYECQRPLSQKTIDMLANEIKTGYFLTGHIAMAILKYKNNYKIMVNGQHQCHSVIEVSIPIEVDYEVYTCFTPMDLSNLYRRFDNHRSRSLSDSLSPEADALNIHWKRRIIRLIVSAAILNENLVSAPKVAKVDLLQNYKKEGNLLDRLINDGVSCRHILRAPVVWAFIKTFQKNEMDAEIFWRDVRDGAKLEKDSPALTLRNYLMSINAGPPRGFEPCAIPKKISSTREIYVKCIHGWNAFREGRKTVLKYTPSAPLPKIN